MKIAGGITNGCSVTIVAGKSQVESTMSQSRTNNGEQCESSRQRTQCEEIVSNQTLSTTATAQTHESDLQGSNQILMRDDNFDSTSNLPQSDTDLDPQEREQEEEAKGKWDKKIEYLLVCSSFVVGIPNLLQFPAMTAKHGGGAFYFVYIIVSCFLGVPLLYMEMSLGQFARRGPISACRIMPVAQGMGYSMVLVSTLFALYNNTYIAWILYYWFSSLNSLLPWHADLTDISSKASDTLLETLPDVVEIGRNHTDIEVVPERLKEAENYFFKDVLNVSDGLSDTGQLQLHLVVCLLLVWLTAAFIIIWGPHSMGKAAYITAIAPFVLLFTMFIALCHIDGAVQGIKAFLMPRWHMLGKIQVWADGCRLVLTTLGCGTGCIITLSGYAHLGSHCFRNCLCVTFASIATTTVAGCCMFSMLGVYGLSSNRPISNLTLTNIDFGFAIFPAVSSSLSVAPLWSVIFYVTLFIAGVSTQAVLLHTIHAEVVWKLHLNTHVRRLVCLIIIFIILFSVSLITATQAGLYVVQLLDKYVYKVAIPCICLLETVVTMWLYGVRRFATRISDMTGSAESPCMRWMWKLGMPIFLMIALGLSVLSEETVRGPQGTENLPVWGQALGWLLSFLPPLVMAGSGIIFFATFSGPFRVRLHKLKITPRDWIPGSDHTDHENTANLPEYVICSPDRHRPSTALALLTANLYLPNIADIMAAERQRRDSTSELSGPGYLSDLMTISSSDDESSEEENKVRGNWSGRFEFVLSCLGYVVGLGNVWRFPYLVYRNGGGAFFIPYLIMLVFCGIPLVYMELAFGQYASLGPITIWRAVPLFKGIGYSMVIVSGVVSIYYNMVNAWGFYYLFTSMTSELPWRSCKNHWNTIYCHENKFDVTNCTSVNMSYVELPAFHNDSCYTVLRNCNKFNESRIGQCVRTLRKIFGEDVITEEQYTNRTSPSEEYFYRSVLASTPGLDNLGEVRWQLALCLLLCWGIIFMCLLKGIKSSGKISYIIVTLPYIFIMVLLIRGITMDGNLDGIKYYVTPRWELLGKPVVWADAATQVFFTLSTCWGGLSTLSSYNKFHNNIYRDTILVVLGDTLMSVMAGFAVFSVIGVLGKELNTSVENVIKSDVGLTFIVYPAAILYFPASPLWSILFFLMLVLMGISTLFTSVETIVTAIIDERLEQLKKKRVFVLSILCASSYLLGLPLTTQGGVHILQLMDEYLAGFPHLVIGLVMCIAIGWVYGVKQFCNDVSHMIGSKVGWWWQGMWYGVCPVIIVFVLIFSSVGYTPLKDKFSEEKYPDWAEAVGFLLICVCLCPIPLVMIYKIASGQGRFMERVRQACQPENDWGPALEKHWKYVEYYPAVHTTMYTVDLDNPPLNTITDHIEFTTVGVRVPSLSEASLLPVSPNLPHTKKPMDMRQKAILNHAYSNPQCNLSSGSIEKLISRPCSSSESALNDIIIMPRPKIKVEMRDAAVQTDLSCLQKPLKNTCPSEENINCISPKRKAWQFGAKRSAFRRQHLSWPENVEVTIPTLRSVSLQENMDLVTSPSPQPSVDDDENPTFPEESPKRSWQEEDGEPAVIEVEVTRF
ncbi:uncharacterized protein [Haliotis cracherodii]|uniref:uncharacterized protein n=1 Tax=Haliotis cracherodii TaxID=6455 RepID=UPI0039E9014A